MPVKYKKAQIPRTGEPGEPGIRTTVNTAKGVKLHMKKKKIILGAVFAVMSSLMVVGPASAAHCVSPEGNSPGFSYFGQDGRTDGNPMGASACRTATGSPSERAPGQNM
jgi:hypothetical protein